MVGTKRSGIPAGVLLSGIETFAVSQRHLQEKDRLAAGCACNHNRGRKAKRRWLRACTRNRCRGTRARRGSALRAAAYVLSIPILTSELTLDARLPSSPGCAQSGYKTAWGIDRCTDTMRQDDSSTCAHTTATMIQSASQHACKSANDLLAAEKAATGSANCRDRHFNSASCGAVQCTYPTLVGAFLMIGHRAYLYS